jgi:hypothetical protein
MKRYSVYVHQNKINGKRYIGITSQKPEDRWRKGKKYTENKQFTDDIIKYGWDNFTHIVICSNLEKKEAENRERDLIIKYNTTDDTQGYNVDFGGISGHILSDKHKSNISEALRGKAKSEKHKKNLSVSHIGNRSAIRKKVLCKETNEIYESMNEAERQTGISAKNISAVCLGKRNIAGGLHWEYAQEGN